MEKTFARMCFLSKQDIAYLSISALRSDDVICLPCDPGQKAVPQEINPVPFNGCKLPGVAGSLPIAFAAGELGCCRLRHDCFMKCGVQWEFCETEFQKCLYYQNALWISGITKSLGCPQFIKVIPFNSNLTLIN